MQVATIQNTIQALEQAKLAIGTPRQEQAYNTALQAVKRAYEDGIRLPPSAEVLAVEIAQAVIPK